MIPELKSGQVGSVQHILNMPKLLMQTACTLFFFTHSLQCTTVKFPDITQLEDLKVKTKADMCTPKSLVCHITAYTNKDQSKLYA